MQSIYAHKDENAIYYECGYSCDNAIFLNIENDIFFFTDSRYEISAKRDIKNANIIINSNNINELINTLKQNNIKHLTLDAKEWSYFDITTIQKANIKIDFQNELSHKKREIKKDKEIDLLKQAVQIGADGFDKFAKEIHKIQTPKSEKYLSFLNLSCMSDFGKYETSFDAIVAINENSALPHALPSDKLLNQNDTLLVDAGIKYKRYCSDRTRTIKVKDDFDFSMNIDFEDRKKQEIYDVVLKAHNNTIEKFEYGMKACDIDAIARNTIEQEGFGKYFIHSTGHGVGLDIHEKPYINKSNTDIIKENMVFTIEPGIYIKDFIGVRIENMVAVKNEKLVIL